ASPRARPTLPMMRARPAPPTSSGSRQKNYVPPAMTAIRNTCTWTPRRAHKFGSKCRCDEIACRVDGVLIFIQRHCRAYQSTFARRKMRLQMTDERWISFTETCSKLNKKRYLAGGKCCESRCQSRSVRRDGSGDGGSGRSIRCRSVHAGEYRMVGH